MSERPGSRFVRFMMNKAPAICAAIFAASLGTASAFQFPYTGGTITTNVFYDGGVGGADNDINPHSITVLQDNYIQNGATLTVLSGTLTIDANDMKVGNGGTAGTLILGANATLNLNNIGQWGGGVGWWTGNTGTLIISNNAVLNWQINGSSEQRFAIGGGQSTSVGTVTLYGGAMNLTYGGGTIGENEAQFSIGGLNGTATVNLNAGILTDALPLPVCLGCYYTSLFGTPALGQSSSVAKINILNGTFAVTDIFTAAVDPIYPDRASFNVGTNSYVNFIFGGTGSLSLTNWDVTNYHALIASSMIRVADCPTTTNTLAYSSVGGMGILKLGSSLVVAASLISPNVVFAGTPIPLHATLYGFTSPTVQWQAGPNGVTWTNIPGATSTNYVVDTSFIGGTTVYYQLVATNTGGATAASAAQSVTINPPTVPSVTAPQSVTNYVGETVLFSVTASGAGTFTYQWRRNTVPMANGVSIHGVSTSTLRLDNITAGQADSYDVVVANFVGPTTSASATLTLLPAPSGNLVGHWLAGASTYADVSGYTPAGTNNHDGFLAGLGTNAVFTNDVPPTATGGQSLYFATNASGSPDTVLAISNSISSDAGYTNTFDEGVTNGFTVMFWAKGAPGAWSWNPWVSKHGEGDGWQFRTGGAVAAGGNPVPCWTVRGGAGTFTLGGGPSWSENGDQDDLHATISGTAAAGNLDYLGVDNNWHFYAGTVDSTLGIRNIYVDGTLYGQEIGCGPFNLGSGSYIALGGRDNGGGSFDQYFLGMLYDVRIYNYALIGSAVRNASGLKPTLNITRNGANLEFSWNWGTLLGATSVTGPWTPITTASPYTNSMTDPQHFFRVSNP